MRVSSKRSIRPSRATSGSLEPRISSMTSSMFSIAMSRPSRMWRRASFSRSSYFVRRTMMSRLVVDVVLDDRQQAERPRYAVDQRDHVHAEGGLELGVLVELVEDDLRDGVALQLDHEPDARLVGLVAQVRDLLQPAVLHLLDDLLHQPAAVAAPIALVDLEGHLGDDDALLATLHRLDVGPAAHDDAAAAGLVRVADAAVADDDAAGREVGALDVLHQALDVDLRVVDVRDRSRRSPRPGCAAGCWWPSRRRCPDEPLTSRFGKRDGRTSGS